MLSMVKSIIDLIPEDNTLRFFIINIVGAIIFTISLLVSKDINDSKTLWFVNGFTASGLILVIYSSSFEIQGAVHIFAIPIIHVIEVILVIWIGNKMIMNDEKDRYAELTTFQTSK